MSTFTVVDDQTLVAAIDRCRHRLVYIAPGITKPVVEAIDRMFERQEVPAITIIIDSDPEVCRMGYGTVEGLNALNALVERHHFVLRTQPGLRVGVLASDDELQVYAPTPQLIEAGSHTERKPNAIAIGRDPLAQLLDAAAAEGVADAPLPSNAEIGQQALTPTKLRESLAELARMPPKAFNVSRVERVFNAQLQYVELEVTGYKLSSRKVNIPNDLLIGEDPDLEKRLRNTFALLEGKASLQVEIASLDASNLQPVLDARGKPKTLRYSEKQLETDRQKLYVDFLTTVKGYGWLIKRWDRPALDRRVKWFRRRVEAYRDGIEELLGASVQVSIRALAEVLLPKLKDRFPDRLRKHLLSATPAEADMLDLVTKELTDAFGRAHQHARPEIRINFKDLTYETIKDPKFREALEVAYGRRGQPSAFSRLFEEFDAARESDEPSDARAS